MWVLSYSVLKSNLTKPGVGAWESFYLAQVCVCPSYMVGYSLGLF